MQITMKDIENRADIELLIDAFYDKVKKDDKIGFIFNDIIGADWSHHLPVMYLFWNMVLFSGAGYAGNPTRKHLEIDKQIRLEKPHFDRWLQLWNGTVDQLYAGEMAEMAKNKAMLMANLISIKIEMGREGKLIQ
jgi:hemoglobin